MEKEELEKAGKEPEKDTAPAEKEEKEKEKEEGKPEENSGTEFPKSKNTEKPKEETEKPKEEPEEEKEDEAEKQEKAIGELKGKYEALLIKDALTDAGEEYGLTRAQIPYIARMMDSEKLITKKGEVNSAELSAQLKGIMAAFPGLKKEPEKDKEANKITLGAPISGEEGSETFAEKIMAAAGLK